LYEPLILSVALVVVNLVLVHFMSISSFYRLAALLAIEGAVCVFFLVRMALSWRLVAPSAHVAPSPA
jgi:hypothetical protein